VEVENGILKMNPDSGVWIRNNLIRAVIRMPELSQLELSGAAEADFSGFSGNRLRIETSGAAKLRGSGGAYDQLDLRSSGAAVADFTDLATVNARINLSGAGRQGIDASEGRLGFKPASILIDRKRGYQKFKLEFKLDCTLLLRINKP